MNFTMAMRVTSWIMLLLAMVCCRPESDRSKADSVNEDKFKRHRQKDAHFVVDILDTSYGLIDVAKMGEVRMEDPERRRQLQRLIQGHTSAMMKLKAYAEQSGIIIPFSGPEKTKASVRKLTGKSSSNFNAAWVKEMKELQHRLKRDIENYQRKSADSALLRVLDTTLHMVKANNVIISGLEIKEDS